MNALHIPEDIVPFISLPRGMPILDLMQMPDSNEPRLGKIATEPGDLKALFLREDPTHSQLDSLLPLLHKLRRPQKEDVECLRVLFHHMPSIAMKQMKSLRYPVRTDEPGHRRLPLWFLAYWAEGDKAEKVKREWRAALAQVSGAELTNSLKTALASIPWDHPVPAQIDYELSNLANLCTSRWLSDMDMDLVAAAINNNLRECRADSCRALSSGYANKLISLYRTDPNGYFTAKGAKFLHNLAALMEDGTLTRIGMYFPVVHDSKSSCSSLPTEKHKGNHWIPVVINILAGTVLFGDSLKHKAPAELHAVIRWWLKRLFKGKKFDFVTLHCIHQTDGFSCGIISMNAIAHRLAPKSFRRIGRDFSVDQCRQDYLASLLRLVQQSALVPGLLNNATLCHPKLVALANSKQLTSQDVAAGLSPAARNLPVKPSAAQQSHKRVGSQDLNEHAAEPASHKRVRRNVILCPIKASVETDLQPRPRLRY